MAPTQRIVSALKQRHPSVPIIGFPRGAGAQIAAYIAETGVDGVSCDTAIPLAHHGQRSQRPRRGAGQSRSALLLAGGEALEQRVTEMLAVLAGKRFVFNLGHGIVPETPPEHVACLVDLVRG